MKLFAAATEVFCYYKLSSSVIKNECNQAIPVGIIFIIQSTSVCKWIEMKKIHGTINKYWCGMEKA